MSALALLGALLLASPTPALNNCVLCHPEQKVEHARSVHQHESISCVSCHGGNPAGTEVRTAHAVGFLGAPKRADIPALCATCHAATVRMRAYNLPSDQYALYQTSVHGQLLAKGDTTVAVCTDCHGLHDIRAVDDPSSSVSPQNIPRTCALCHGDPAFLVARHKTDNPYELYLGSVHGQALLTKGDADAPDCARCHGAHGAAPPGVGDVDKVCGQCHGPTRAYYLESPHHEAFQQARLPECASCHGHHRVEHTSVEQLETMCLKCHERGSPEVARSQEMRTAFDQANDEIERARVVVRQAAAIPLHVEDYEARLAEARTTLQESLPLIHSLDLGRVQATARRSRSIAGEVELDVRAKLGNLRWRKVGLVILWFYLLLTIAVLVRWRRAAEDHA